MFLLHVEISADHSGDQLGSGMANVDPEIDAVPGQISNGSHGGDTALRQVSSSRTDDETFLKQPFEGEETSS